MVYGSSLENWRGCKSSGGSNPLSSVIINIPTTDYQWKYFLLQSFQERWDELIERVEGGETFGIVNDDGKTAVMMPTSDPMYQMYIDHDEAS